MALCRPCVKTPTLGACVVRRILPANRFLSRVSEILQKETHRLKTTRGLLARSVVGKGLEKGGAKDGGRIGNAGLKGPS